MFSRIRSHSILFYDMPTISWFSKRANGNPDLHWRGDFWITVIDVYFVLTIH